MTQEQILMGLPEVRPLMVVPGIQPFVRPELVSDLIDMYNWAGISHVITTLELVHQDLTPNEWIDQLVLIYVYGNADFAKGMVGLGEAILEVDSEADLVALEALFHQGGVDSLTEVIRNGDPANPSSIVFNHPTQRLNRETEKIEIAMIKNEPEVAERFDIEPCACGSRKITAGTVQHSRGDESWDIWMTCVVCKLKWRLF